MLKLEKWLKSKANKAEPDKIIVDGKRYACLSDVSHAYHVDLYFINERLKQGWTLEKAVHTPAVKTVSDHLGNKFETIKKMCEYWGITSFTFAKRIKNGKSLKEALTTPVKRGRK